MLDRVNTPLVGFVVVVEFLQF